MATGHINEPLATAEVHPPAEALQEWWGQLTARERAMVRQILESTNPADSDVQGYYGFMGSILSNAGLPPINLEPHAATPVQSAGVGAAVGGGANAATRLN
jgi:hypothetical protein